MIALTSGGAFCRRDGGAVGVQAGLVGGGLDGADATGAGDDPAALDEAAQEVDVGERQAAVGAAPVVALEELDDADGRRAVDAVDLGPQAGAAQVVLQDTDVMALVPAAKRAGAKVPVAVHAGAAALLGGQLGLVAALGLSGGREQRKKHEDGGGQRNAERVRAPEYSIWHDGNNPLFPVPTGLAVGLAQKEQR